MQFKVGGTGPLIALLAIVALGAIAFAIPAAPIESPTGEGRQGCLIGHATLSDLLAEQLAANGYHYIAVDLGSARLEDGALWIGHLDRVSKRLFPVWGWVDTRSAGFRHAQQFIRELNLAGMYVYGPDAAVKAEELRSGRAGFEIVPVIRDGEKAPASGRYAVALDLGEFWDRAEEYDLPVLRADILDPDKVEDAREVAGRDYLVALTPLRD
jgi:hypothetical protein